MYRSGYDHGSVHLTFMVDKAKLWEIFLQGTTRSHLQCCGFNALYSSSSKRCSCRKDNVLKVGSLPKSNALSETGDPCKAKYFHFIIQGINPTLSIWSLTFERLNVICFI